MALPAKELYSLDECAKHWEIGIDDVLEYVRIGALIPAITCDAGILIELWEGYPPSRDSDGVIKPHKNAQMIDSVHIPAGWRYIWNYSQQRRYSGLTGEFIKLSESVLTEELPDQSKHWGIPLLNDDIQIPIKNLRIPLREIKRFEELFKKDPKPLSGKERENLLRIIGVMAQVLVKNNEKLGNIAKINLSALAKLMLEHIADYNLDAQGMSNSNLREKIKNALDLID